MGSLSITYYALWVIKNPVPQLATAIVSYACDNHSVYLGLSMCRGGLDISTSIDKSYKAMNVGKEI